MYISQIIDELQELRSEYNRLAHFFKTVENSYSYNEMPFLSDGWWDQIHEYTNFREEGGDWYSFLTFHDNDDENEIALARRVLENPEINKQYLENVSTYVFEGISHEKAYEYISKGLEIIQQVQNISTQHGLGGIGFESDIFLGLDSIHYESSRCW